MTPPVTISQVRASFSRRSIPALRTKPAISRSDKRDASYSTRSVCSFASKVMRHAIDAHDPDTNEALSDFQEYAHRVRESLRTRGIEFHEVYGNRFGITHGKTVVIFAPDKVQVGYYLIAPNKKPRIEYGVNTDDGLLQMADEYFGPSKTGSPR